MGHYFNGIGQAYSRSLEKAKKHNPEAAFLMEELNNEIIRAERLQDDMFGKCFTRMNNPACREYVDEKLRPLYSQKYLVLDQLICEHKHTHIEGNTDFIGGAYFDTTREICDDCGAKIRFHASSLPESIVEIS